MATKASEHNAADNFILNFLNFSVGAEEDKERGRVTRVWSAHKWLTQLQSLLIYHIDKFQQQDVWTSRWRIALTIGKLQGGHIVAPMRPRDVGSWMDGATDYTYKSFQNLIKSNWNEIVFTIFQLIWNKSEYRLVTSKYNQISVRFKKIQKWFLCVIS